MDPTTTTTHGSHFKDLAILWDSQFSDPNRVALNLYLRREENLSNSPANTLQAANAALLWDTTRLVEAFLDHNCEGPKGRYLYRRILFQSFLHGANTKSLTHRTGKSKCFLDDYVIRKPTNNNLLAYVSEIGLVGVQDHTKFGPIFAGELFKIIHQKVSFLCLLCIVVSCC